MVLPYLFNQEYGFFSTVFQSALETLPTWLATNTHENILSNMINVDLQLKGLKSSFVDPTHASSAQFTYTP